MKHIQVDIDEYDFSDGVRGKYSDPAVEQAEPVAWQYRWRNGRWHDCEENQLGVLNSQPDYETRKLFTHPPATDERLREALKEIADEKNWSLGIDEIGKACMWCMDYEHTPNCPVRIAREALGTQEPEDEVD